MEKDIAHSLLRTHEFTYSSAVGYMIHSPGACIKYHANLGGCWALYSPLSRHPYTCQL